MTKPTKYTQLDVIQAASDVLAHNINPDEGIEQFMREHYPRADPVVHCRGLSLRPSIFEQVLNVTLHCPNRTMLQARATCTIEILGRNPF